MSLQPLRVPFRYAMIEDGLYRDAYPTLKNFRFLVRLRLRTVISLTPEPPTVDLQQFFRSEKISSHYVKVDKYNEAVTLQPRAVAEILQWLINADNLPCYVHCLDGANVTGLVVMCLRKLQNYTLPFIFSEFFRFVREGVFVPAEKEFVRNFGDNLTVNIPPNIPRWLWQGRRISKHPSIRLVDSTAPAPATGGEIKTTDRKTPSDPSSSVFPPSTVDGARLERKSYLYYDSIHAPLSSDRLYYEALDEVLTTVTRRERDRQFAAKSAVPIAAALTVKHTPSKQPQLTATATSTLATSASTAATTVMQTSTPGLASSTTSSSSATTSAASTLVTAMPPPRSRSGAVLPRANSSPSTISYSLQAMALEGITVNPRVRRSGAGAKFGSKFSSRAPK